MSLALRLGKTLDELTTSISVSELRMWREFDRISPIGDLRDDFRSAQIVSAVYQSTGIEMSIQEARLKFGDELLALVEEERNQPHALEAYFDAVAE